MVAAAEQVDTEHCERGRSAGDAEAAGRMEVGSAGPGCPIAVMGRAAVVVGGGDRAVGGWIAFVAPVVCSLAFTCLFASPGCANRQPRAAQKRQ